MAEKKHNFNKNNIFNYKESVIVVVDIKMFNSSDKCKKKKKERRLSVEIWDLFFFFLIQLSFCICFSFGTIATLDPMYSLEYEVNSK